MEEGSKCEEAKQGTLDFKCRKIVNADRKLEAGIASSTPEKAIERLGAKSKQVAIEIPERCKAVVELFRQLICSLRLLRLCKKSPTFHNICPQVEILAKRKFSYKHLAQIKYMLPEAVRIDKILRHDEESQCMKPDLKITLVYEVVKDHQQKSDFMAFCQLFFSRAVDFYTTHSEDCDIPEATLPEPFSKENEYVSSEAVLQQTSIDASSVDFRLLKDLNLISSPIKENSVESATAQRVNSLHTSRTKPDSPAGSSRACDSPLMNRNSEAANFMIETPAKLTPKRPMLESEDSVITISNRTLMSSEKPAKRSLDFMYEKADGYVLENTIRKTEHLNTMERDILLASNSKEYMAESKAGKNKEEEDGGNTHDVPGPDLNVVTSEMSGKMSSSLRGCITTIHHIFQSVNYSSVTKQELVFKILVNSLDLEEKGMVEEQLEQLELQLPNWISKRISPSGDLLYSVKKPSDISAVLAELQS